VPVQRHHAGFGGRKKTGENQDNDQDKKQRAQ
jgi:hypothetical protein